MVSSKKLKENRSKFLNKSLFDDKKKLLKLRKFVEQNFEFVGNKFGEKVREIYYDKKSKKSIYGTTTIDEKEALEDEGIDLLSIPWVSKDN
jgi:hypothetical protein